MDFTEFIWILENSALHFTRGDCFSDCYEGMLSKPNIDALRKANDIRYVDQFVKPVRRHVAINCWHINEYDVKQGWYGLVRAAG
jgi:hypothetical protein